MMVIRKSEEADFAANLGAVAAGAVSDDYATPESFFRITFLTEGLKRVLRGVLQRLAGTGGDPARSGSRTDSNLRCRPQGLLR